VVKKRRGQLRWIDFTALLHYHQGMMRKLSLLCVVCLSLLISQAAEQPAEFKAGGLTFKRPEKFEWVPIQPGMRAAQLKVPGKDEKSSAEVVFFVFGAGDGGAIQANVDRWLGMFQEGKDKVNAKVEKVKKGDTQITYVRGEGTYMSGMPGGAKTALPNAMLQGAILEGKEGNVFIRMTGPADLVKSSQDAFKKMVEGAAK
jgi:hypothetical protein